MKRIKFTACLLALVLPLTLASCSWWFTTPNENGRLPDDIGASANTDGNPSDDDYEMTGIPDINSIDKLPEGFEFFKAPDESCVVAYKDKSVLVFDYMLGEVTPLVNFEAMIEVADPIKRAREYFTDVTLDVECEMRNEREIKISFIVTSNTHEASYRVYSFYTVENYGSGNYPRGTVRGYYTVGKTVYPGSDDPVVITDIEDWNKLGGEEYEDDWLYKNVKAFLECDATALEEATYSQKGTLTPWESVKISDYKIMRENPTSIHFDAVTLIVNITESGIERYPVGEYKVVIADGPGDNFMITPTDAVPDMHNPSAHELFVRNWVTRFGGWYPVDSQTLENPGYAHQITDLYLWSGYNGENEVKFEDFVEFCKEYFGYEDAEKYVARGDVENHGGHGGSTALCDVKLEASSGNTYIYTATFFADQLKTTVAYVHIITVVAEDSENYRIADVECVVDNGFLVFSWSI